jgi:outer membrane protein, heavy metal efflux system
MKAVILCLAVVAPAIAHADDAAPVRELLAQPAQLAGWLGGRDPIAEAQRAHVESAAATARQTRVLPNPTLNFGVSDIVLGKNNPPDMELSLSQTLIYAVGVQQLFELGKRGPRQSAADLRVREAGETAVGTMGDRLNNAQQVLGKLAYVTARRSVVATNLEAAQKLMSTEKNRVDKQDLSPLEFARIELDTREIQIQLGRADSDLAVAVATCSATVYAPCSPSGLDATALDAGAPLPPQLPDLRRAIEDRPARLASKLEIEALGWDATLAHNRRIPDPTLGVGYTLDNLLISGDQHQSLLFTVELPLPFFDRGTHDEQAARSNARAAAAEDRAAVRDASGQVEALLAQRASLEGLLRTLETEAVPKSTQIIRQTRTAFDLKEARLADLLLAERQHRDLLLEVLDARFDLFNVRVALRKQLGLDDAAVREAAGRRRP